MPYLFVLLLSLTVGLGPLRQHTTPPPPPMPRVFCEASFTNFAWGYQHNGIYLDAEGHLYRYGYQPKDKRWAPERDDAPTAAELEDKYSHGRKLLRTIEPQEWKSKLDLLMAAQNGAMSEWQQRGADMGAAVRRCYVADRTGERYKQVELRVRGDRSYENLAPSAKPLATWLDSLYAEAYKEPPR